MLRIKEPSAFVLSTLLFSFALCFGLAGTDAFSADKSAKLGGKEVFEQKCLKCHKPTKFKNRHHTRREWEQILTRMELNTCELTDAEAKAVADYLVKEHGD